MKSEPFTSSFEFGGETYQAEASYNLDTNDFALVIRKGDERADEGVWRPEEYAQEGFENEELAEAAIDRFFDTYDFYTDKWHLTLNTLASGEGAVAVDAIDRIGGAPIGVTLARWPSMNEEPMQHLITIDAKHFDEGVLPEGAAAVALFMWNPAMNEAFEVGTNATRVLFLSAEELARGEIEERPRGYDASREVAAAPLVVEETRSAFSRLTEHIGRPIHWCQSPEGEEEAGPFLFQFTESLMDVNLGDGGTMYVFRDVAFWQCH